MIKNIRTARLLVDLAIGAKHGTRDAAEKIEFLKHGADKGLDVVEALENAVIGEFGVADSLTLGLTAYNWAPRIDPTLRKKKLWSWREG